jgi:hypothetical protein
LRSGNCESAENRLGMLHYHFRDPLLVVQHAIRDSIQFGHLPVGTTVDNVGQQRQRLEHLISRRGTIGGFKLVEILSFLNKGRIGLTEAMYKLFPPSTPVTEWMPVEQVIQQAKVEKSTV